MEPDQPPIYWPPRRKRKDAERFCTEAWTFWDSFYKNHKSGFFKDRHYLARECPELLNGRKVILEVGCGVGNTVFPVLARNPQAFVHACDFAPEAISCLKGDPEYSTARVNAFVCDITKDTLADFIEPASVDICTMIFVLSAISPQLLIKALLNIASVLRPTGRVFVRDYAAGDLAESLLSQSQQIKKLDEHFFVRGDGTCSFYFTEESLRNVFSAADMVCDSILVHEREVENHALQAKMQRRWIQASFSLKDARSSRPGGDTRSIESCSDAVRVLPEWEDDEQLDDHDDGMGSMFDTGESQTEVEEVYQLHGCGQVRVKSISREARHTLAHTGLMLWDAAHSFACFLAKQEQLLAGKKVLELGCGANPLCTLACLRHATKVVATDGSSKALLMMAQNLALNASKVVIERARLRELSWEDNQQCERLQSEHPQGFEVIIGADIVYVAEHIQPLFRTAKALLSKTPQRDDSCQAQLEPVSAEAVALSDVAPVVMNTSLADEEKICQSMSILLHGYFSHDGHNKRV